MAGSVHEDSSTDVSDISTDVSGEEDVAGIIVLVIKWRPVTIKIAYREHQCYHNTCVLAEETCRTTSVYHACEAFKGR
jgi:hypothetical protein